MWEIVDFYADWCGPCQAMKPILEKFEQDYKGKVTLKRVNVDENQMEALKNNVMSIPTFVIFKSGLEIARTSGAMSYEMFKSWVDSYVKN